MEDHIIFDKSTGGLRLLDQRLLPAERKTVDCGTAADVIDAIRNMVVRGAPAIGVAAAFGCVIAANAENDSPGWRTRLKAALEAIARARPTAVNLAWAVKRMDAIADWDGGLEALRKSWLLEACKIQEEDREVCRKIGFAGEAVIRDGDTVLTHCNAGALATAGYGTALGVVRAAVESDKSVKVIAGETRPWLQGARLTAYELAVDGIPVKVACDNACAILMSTGNVQLVITGADRIAANGDTANKIGTYGVAILAAHFHLPFYIAAPLSTVDLSLANGGLIPIEERPEDEVRIINGKKIVPDGVGVYNFAFDVTPADLISGIITEAGILRPPYGQSLAQAVAGANPDGA